MPGRKAPLPHQALLYRRAILPTRASRPLKDLHAYRAECHYEGAAARTPPEGPATGRAPHYGHQQQAWLPRRPRPPCRTEAAGAKERQGSARPGDPARVSAEERECRSAPEGPGPRAPSPKAPEGELRTSPRHDVQHNQPPDGGRTSRRSGTRIELPAVMQGREAARA